MRKKEKKTSGNPGNHELRAWFYYTTGRDVNVGNENDTDGDRPIRDKSQATFSNRKSM